MKRIVLAGGCFWGVEAYFKSLKGVLKTSVGYTNGNIAQPTYQDLKSQLATHAEACEVIYDENIITLEKLLEHLFRFIDPTALNRQGNDFGLQYRTGIYYNDDQDKKVIDAFLKQMQKYYKKAIVVEGLREQGYFLAEEYHQNYLDVNPTGYCHVNLNLIRESEKK